MSAGWLQWFIIHKDAKMLFHSIETGKWVLTGAVGFFFSIFSNRSYVWVLLEVWVVFKALQALNMRPLPERASFHWDCWRFRMCSVMIECYFGSRRAIQSLLTTRNSLLFWFSKLFSNLWHITAFTFRYLDIIDRSYNEGGKASVEFHLPERINTESFYLLATIFTLPGVAATLFYPLALFLLWLNEGDCLESLMLFNAILLWHNITIADSLFLIKDTLKNIKNSCWKKKHLWPEVVYFIPEEQSKETVREEKWVLDN